MYIFSYFVHWNDYKNLYGEDLSSDSSYSFISNVHATHSYTYPAYYEVQFDYCSLTFINDFEYDEQCVGESDTIYTF